MLRNLPEKSTAQRIRDEFERVGAMSTLAFTRHCLEIGMWSTDELLAQNIRAGQAEVRKALKQPDTSGLPFAGMTTTRDDEDSPIWQTRLLWAFEDYELNCHELIRQSETLHRTAFDLAAECANRYGRMPNMSGGRDSAEAAD